MNNLGDVGNLMHLYMHEINPGKGTDSPEFLIAATAKILKESGGRNWVPVIIKETGEDEYEVIGNSFIYAVAEEAGLEKIWCIIADSKDTTVELTQVLCGEVTPKINLSSATRDEIKTALQYLIEKPGTELKSVKLLVATDRIDEAPRQYWKTLEPITKLGCGITKGKKLNALKEVFYLAPQPMPEVSKEPINLKTLTVGELRTIAKKRGITGYSKKKKDELVKLLS